MVELRPDRKDKIWRRAVHRLGPGPLLLRVSLADCVEEGEAGAVAAVVGVRGVHGFKQVMDVTHVDTRLAHGVRFFHNLTRLPSFKPFNCFKFCEVVQGIKSIEFYFGTFAQG